MDTVKEPTEYLTQYLILLVLETIILYNFKLTVISDRTLETVRSIKDTVSRKSRHFNFLIRNNDNKSNR